MTEKWTTEQRQMLGYWVEINEGKADVAKLRDGTTKGRLCFKMPERNDKKKVEL